MAERKGFALAEQIEELLLQSVPQDVILHDATDEANNGTPYAPDKTVMLTFEITGTSTSRTVVFETAGPSGVFVSQQCMRVSDNAFAAQTTDGNDTAPESWTVVVSAGWTFRARISEVGGGNVSIKGKAAG
jgi:hypothetical protein